MTYADDMVLMAENKGEMKNITERLEGYLKRKDLKLNTKIMEFRKGGGR